MNSGLILISCSRNKEIGGQDKFRKHFLLKHLSEKNFTTLIEKRRTVLHLIRSAAKVKNIEHKEVKRQLRKANQLLIDGPDLGGNEYKAVYLPAKKDILDVFT